MLGALEHFAWVGREYGATPASSENDQAALLRKGMAVVQAHETNLSHKLLERLYAIPGMHIYGQDDPKNVENRVPTVAINLKGKHPTEVARGLAAEDIYVWSGNYYALAVTERLGVEDSGGMVRIGAAQYNSEEEIEKLGNALEKIAGS